MGGAVNIVTKEYPPFYFDGAYEVGSFNTHRLNAILKRTDAAAYLKSKSMPFTTTSGA